VSPLVTGAGELEEMGAGRFARPSMPVTCHEVDEANRDSGFCHQRQQCPGRSNREHQYLSSTLLATSTSILMRVLHCFSTLGKSRGLDII
jgi:hypothetical protein